MKKLISGFVAGVVLSSSIFAVLASSDQWTALKATFKVFVKGEEFKSDKPIVAIDGSTYLPLKAIGDALGVNVVWNSDLKRVEVAMDGQQNGSTQTSPAPSSPSPKVSAAPKISSDLSIKIDKVQGKKGDVVDLYVSLSDVPAAGIAQCNINLKYDNKAIEILEVIAGDIVPEAKLNFYSNVDAEKGSITFLYGDEGEKGNFIKNNGKFAKISVKIIDNGSISLDDSTYFGDSNVREYEYKNEAGGVQVAQ
jgi:hypothetical protein